ncbi:MAG: redoxin domain-containing protein [Saprospiraceae bacterium]|nr:redoxin domain-containing protein [Saprospiraceae bacterium]
MKNDLIKLFLTGLAIFTLHNTILARTNSADEGYEIKVKLTDYTSDTLYLGYQMGGQTYLNDTATLDKKTGFFTFKKDKKLAAGVYILVVASKDNYFQIMVNDKEQIFAMTTTVNLPYNDATFKGSKDNDLFYNYMKFLSSKRKDAEAAGALKARDSVAAVKKFDELDKEVKAYQWDLVKKNPTTVAAILIKSAIEIEMPKFDEIKDADKKQMAQYIYYKQHCFDHFELGNPALLRTPVLQQRIDYYIDKLTPQHPDSVYESCERILEMMKPAKETFQYYFIQFLNRYAKSNLVGFDAIYVHLAKKYIETGQTDGFIEKDNKEKILQNANKLDPILIGKKAPEIKLFKEDNSLISLYEVKAKYTVLFFFAPDCGHCQKQSPFLVEFFKNVKAKNWDVKVVAVCTYIGTDKMPECWKYTKEKGFDEFINTIDPYMISRYKTLYNVETTPQVYVLDENKIIRSKNIETKQLEEIIEFLMKEDAEKINKDTKGK